MKCSWVLVVLAAVAALLLGVTYARAQAPPPSTPPTPPPYQTSTVSLDPDGNEVRIADGEAVGIDASANTVQLAATGNLVRVESSASQPVYVQSAPTGDTKALQVFERRTCTEIFQDVDTAGYRAATIFVSTDDNRGEIRSASLVAYHANGTTIMPGWNDWSSSGGSSNTYYSAKARNLDGIEKIQVRFWCTGSTVTMSVFLSR